MALLLAAAGYRSHDYPASLRAGIPELDLGAPPPLLAEAVPSLRRIAFAIDGPDPAVDPGLDDGRAAGGRATVERRRARRGRGRRHARPTAW